MKRLETAAVVAACCCLWACGNTNGTVNESNEGDLGTGAVRSTLKRGHFVHLYATKQQAAINKAKLKNTAGTTPALQYFGGPVLAAVKPVAVYWGPNVNAQTVSYMPGFYTSITQSTYLDWLKEYNTNVTPVGGGTGTNQSIVRGTYGGTYTITPANTATSIQDADIQTEISGQISAGNLPAPDANTLYMMHFPPGMTITSGGSGSCTAFCAYHGTMQINGSDVFYGVLPDFGPGSGCDTGCGTNANMIDNFTSAASHEWAESITDAAVGLATTSGPPLAWYDNTNGEIGDICAPGSGVAANAGDGTLVGSNGTTYTVQLLWSNLQGTCVDSGGGTCVPACNGAVCGSDGCGGSCGTCAAGQTCTGGQCVTATCTGCVDSTGTCQTGTSATACGTGGNACVACAAGDSCVNGVCQAATCTGCVDSSGTCQTGNSTSACGTGGNACVACAAGDTCTNGVCSGTCVPQCNGAVCGSDGCGGSCGTCPAGDTCSGGQCVSSGGTCSHPICHAGQPLDPNCDPCAGNVCQYDPYCCTYAWDSQCVSEVGSICGQSCSGGGNTCSHAICKRGAALDPGCDPCAGDICSLDSYCCSVKWDRQCVSEVGSICGESCP